MSRAPALFPLLALALLLSACGGGSEPEATSTLTPPTDTSTPAPGATEAAEPTPQAPVPSASPATELSLPAGFTAYAIAEGFYRPTSIALAPDGTIYVSERHGKVLRLADNDGDGVFAELVTFATPPQEITGLLAAPDGGLYVSSTGRLLLVRDTDADGVGDTTEAVIAGLPTGRHQNNGLVFGPDGKLYLTNGSTCDDVHDCPAGGEPDERSATILQANPDGSGLRVYASGLRNPYDLVFDAQGRLWATDNGSDAPCATIDELNLIQEGGDYGWPYAVDGCDAFRDGIPPVASLGLHTASTGIDYYDGSQFPAEYQGNLFLTLWGSDAYRPELGPQLMRVVPSARGGPAPGRQLAMVETFATGFQNPIDVVVDRDGTLLVLDYGSGKLYRIVHAGG